MAFFNLFLVLVYFSYKNFDVGENYHRKTKHKIEKKPLLFIKLKVPITRFKTTKLKECNETNRHVGHRLSLDSTSMLQDTIDFDLFLLFYY